MQHPPVATRIAHTWVRSTGDVVDHYAWLADRTDPDVIAYLDAENRYAAEWYEPLQPLVDTIFHEIKHRTLETDTEAPVRSGAWWYTSNTIEGGDYPIYRRGLTSETATDDIVLDLNTEAAGHEFFELGALDVTPDHQFVAWSADTDGDEHFTLRVRDIGRGCDLDDELVDTSAAGTAWSADGHWLFYVVADAHERPHRVMRHEIGTDQATDVEVFRDDDEHFYVSVGLTRNERAIVIDTASSTSSESWFIDADEPTSSPRVIRNRRDNVEYHVDHWGDRWVVVTNLDAVDFRLVQAPLEHPDEWAGMLAHEPGRRLTRIEAFADFVAVEAWADAQPQIFVVDRTGDARPLSIDPEPHSIGFGPNEDFTTDRLRLQHQSLTTPPRTIDIDVDTSTITVVKQRPTPNTDLDAYRSTRLWATADDGTAVPVDIVHHVDTQLDGTAPCTVYGYGAYEVSMSPWFSAARLSLLDRGHVFAVVYPRGGGELGRGWYLDGKLLNKRNTFTDTITVCDHLRAVGVAGTLALRGGSAGGLLVGACVTMAPDRFDAAIAEVPFVDVVTTMSDPDLPLTVTEWDEWGDPRDEPYASYMASYSPYDNTVAASYPAMYVSAGLNDPRVGFHEPAKWVARLRHVRTNDAPLLLRTEMGAGHRGPSGRYDAWRDEAHILAFTHHTLTSR